MSHRNCPERLQILTWNSSIAHSTTVCWERENESTCCSCRPFRIEWETLHIARHIQRITTHTKSYSRALLFWPPQKRFDGAVLETNVALVRTRKTKPCIKVSESRWPVPICEVLQPYLQLEQNGFQRFIWAKENREAEKSCLISKTFVFCAEAKRHSKPFAAN